jgi:hypothetical protein
MLGATPGVKVTLENGVYLAAAVEKLKKRVGVAQAVAVFCRGIDILVDEEENLAVKGFNFFFKLILEGIKRIRPKTVSNRVVLARCKVVAVHKNEQLAVRLYVTGRLYAENGIKSLLVN